MAWGPFCQGLRQLKSSYVFYLKPKLNASEKFDFCIGHSRVAVAKLNKFFDMTKCAGCDFYKFLIFRGMAAESIEGGRRGSEDVGGGGSLCAVAAGNGCFTEDIGRGSVGDTCICLGCSGAENVGGGCGAVAIAAGGSGVSEDIGRGTIGDPTVSAGGSGAENIGGDCSLIAVTACDGCSSENVGGGAVGLGGGVGGEEADGQSGRERE